MQSEDKSDFTQAPLPVQTLPFALRRLVSRSVALLGEIIRKELGDDAFVQIDTLRKEMSHLRHIIPNQKYEILNKRLESMQQLDSKRRFQIAHSFTLMLELMNACENAYRTYRLRSRKNGKEREAAVKPESITYVLTAHPSEARSPSNVAVFHKLQQELTKSLELGFNKNQQHLRHLIEVAWRIPVARAEKPKVSDEAEFIFSIVLRPENLEALLLAKREIASVQIRTWVGGDKDGHSGVNESTMLSSLNLSRRYILAFMKSKVSEVKATAELLKDPDLVKICSHLNRIVSALRRLSKSDGKRIAAAKIALDQTSERYRLKVGETHPAFADLQELSRIFPAWVIPLELRDSSDQIVEAASGSRIAIRRMVERLADLSHGGQPSWYVSGLIISMASQLEHIRAGELLVSELLGRNKIPVVPLFEERIALERSEEIVREMLKDRKPGDQMEIMLGYSDSAKEMGALPSRLMLAETVHRLDQCFQESGVIPIFFHGSGGSVDRGGGSIEDQTAWLPDNAIKRFKSTIQGEMVDRTFSSPEIFLSQVTKVSNQLGQVGQTGQMGQGNQLRPPGKNSRPIYTGSAEEVRNFASRVEKAYSEKVRDSDFFQVVEKASAYRYLHTLRLGSRPSSRRAKTSPQQKLSLKDLRAIPWVLSWTQSRVLFPTWWGIGSALKSSNPLERTQLQKSFTDDPLLRSFVKVLGFTLAKVELPIWRIYLEQSHLNRDHALRVFAEFQEEYDLAVEFVQMMSGETNLLWFRPWLSTSVMLRSAMIHPLNLLQILNQGPHSSQKLVRETVTGIASGMMTTG